jgi:hypothetical protein
MPFFEFIMSLVCLVVLSSYLYIKQCEREDRQLPRPNPVARPGTGIDTTRLTPAVTEVRRNYRAARQSAKGVFFRRSLLGLARQNVARLSFFRHRKSEEHAPFNAAS